MTTVVIESVLHNGNKFRAFAKERESVGRTMGEALDALVDSLDSSNEQTSVLVKDFRPDEFFPEAQQRRLSSSMTKWRSARDAGLEFSDAEQLELESLVEAELEGVTKRTEALHSAG